MPASRPVSGRRPSRAAIRFRHGLRRRAWRPSPPMRLASRPCSTIAGCAISTVSTTTWRIRTATGPQFLIHPPMAARLRHRSRCGVVAERQLGFHGGLSWNHTEIHDTALRSRPGGAGRAARRPAVHADQRLRRRPAAPSSAILSQRAGIHRDHRQYTTLSSGAQITPIPTGMQGYTNFFPTSRRNSTPTAIMKAACASLHLPDKVQWRLRATRPTGEPAGRHRPQQPDGFRQRPARHRWRQPPRTCSDPRAGETEGDQARSGIATIIGSWPQACTNVMRSAGAIAVVRSLRSG